MRFHGDLIITDPAFVAKSAEDWKACAYGDHMEALGLRNFLVAYVTEGEEDLGAYGPEGELLGTFVSDSGLAGAFLLEELLAYDPGFDEHIECPENALWLRDFDGTVEVTGDGEDQRFQGRGNVDFETR